MQKMMYLVVSQHVSGIIMPIIRRMVQNRQRLWCTALAVMQKTRGEEVVGVQLLGMVSRLKMHGHMKLKNERVSAWASHGDGLGALV
jgi:hypothetical protein